MSHILNVAVKQKRLAVNPCMAVEFPVSVKKSTRKPHYMTATEQEKIEIAAPSYLRNIVVIISEMGLRYKKELLPMKKEEVDLENGLVHIADSKTTNGIGDMPLTQAGSAEAVHDQSPQDLGGNAEESGGAILRPVRTSAHVRNRAKRRWGRRPYGDADVETGRCRSLQAVQSGEAWNDARGAGQDGPASERAGNFEHTEAELDDFCAHFLAQSPFSSDPEGKRNVDSEGFSWSGRRDLNPGPLAPQASALARLRHGPNSFILAQSLYQALRSATKCTDNSCTASSFESARETALVRSRRWSAN